MTRAPAQFRRAIETQIFSLYPASRLTVLFLFVTPDLVPGFVLIEALAPDEPQLILKDDAGAVGHSPRDLAWLFPPVVHAGRG
jgi:hypothetical protein